MKPIVCGGRDYADRAFVFATLDRLRAKHPDMEAIHGGASGADSLAGEWARDRGVKVTVCKADWRRHGRAAGPIRNGEMLELLPDGVVAFPGGSGTADMIRQAGRADVKVWDLRTHESAKAQ